MILLLLFLVVTGALGALLSACDNCVQPEPEPVAELGFFALPATDSLTVSARDHADFRVGATASGPLQVVWVLDGDSLAAGPRFRFFPRRPGSCVLEAVSCCEGITEVNSWHLSVLDDHPGEFSFLPAGDEVRLVQLDTCRFQVFGDYPFEREYSWSLGGLALPGGAALTLQLDRAGVDTLSVEVATANRTITRRWILHVEPYPVEFSFDPPERQLGMTGEEARLFSLACDCPFPHEFTWTLDGQAVGDADRFLLEAPAEGIHNLQVEITTPDSTLTHQWAVGVAASRPPAVNKILCQDGPVPGSLQASWSAVQTSGGAPIAGYEVAFSLYGAIDSGSWAEATYLAEVDSGDLKSLITRLFTPEEHGLVPGRRIWLAVRPVDELGLTSEIVTNASFFLSRAYWVEGVVRDETGHPLAGVSVSDNLLGMTVVTALDGAYRLGPYTDGQAVILQTNSPDEDQAGQPGTSWYDYSTESFFPAEMPQRDIYLLTRWGADPDCGSFSGSFKTLFIYETRTFQTSALRPNHRLYKWAEYPVGIYIPEHDFAGLDFKALATECVQWWNHVLDEQVFFLSPSRANAQVLVKYEDLGGHANGRLRLVSPSEEPFMLGDVVPRKMELSVEETFDDAQRVQETVLHELGHVLGLYRHPTCNRAGYLMYVTASGALDDGWENAIHVDEVRAVRAIVNLPQGYDMAGFE